MFVVYDLNTTQIIEGRNFRRFYKTEAAAKAAVSRAGQRPGSLGIAEAQEFFDKIELKETRWGIGPSEGNKYEVGVNTGWTTGPWSETYWAS